MQGCNLHWCSHLRRSHFRVRSSVVYQGFECAEVNSLDLTGACLSRMANKVELYEATSSGKVVGGFLTNSELAMSLQKLLISIDLMRLKACRTAGLGGGGWKLREDMTR